MMDKNAMDKAVKTARIYRQARKAKGLQAKQAGLERAAFARGDAAADHREAVRMSHRGWVTYAQLAVFLGMTQNELDRLLVDSGFLTPEGGRTQRGRRHSSGELWDASSVAAWILDVDVLA